MDEDMLVERTCSPLWGMASSGKQALYREILETRGAQHIRRALNRRLLRG